ncbi:hypothetical protein DFH06DRAFT_1117986 [Mycena polygramma]|nr:hypothetical protein DFH06DRAFT_1117986 [Mycena polygramma]
MAQVSGGGAWERARAWKSKLMRKLRNVTRNPLGEGLDIDRREQRKRTTDASPHLAAPSERRWFPYAAIRHLFHGFLRSRRHLKGPTLRFILRSFTRSVGKEQRKLPKMREEAGGACDTDSCQGWFRRQQLRMRPLERRRRVWVRACKGRVASGQCRDMIGFESDAITAIATVLHLSTFTSRSEANVHTDRSVVRDLLQFISFPLKFSLKTADGHCEQDGDMIYEPTSYQEQHPSQEETESDRSSAQAVVDTPERPQSQPLPDRMGHFPPSLHDIEQNAASSSSEPLAERLKSDESTLGTPSQPNTAAGEGIAGLGKRRARRGTRAGRLVQEQKIAKEERRAAA